MAVPSSFPHRSPRTPLAGIRVLDASAGVAGQFCGRLFADFGADVVLAEHPGRRSTRHWVHPQTGSASDSLFWHLNQGKRSADLTVAHSDLHYDVFITDGSQAVTPPTGVLVCSISRFGEEGPYRDWRGPEIVMQSLSGTAYTTGRQDREPLYGFGHRVAYSAGAALYAAAVAQLFAISPATTRRNVAVNEFEVAVAMSQNAITQYAYNHTQQDRSQYSGPLGMFELADGWAFLFILPGRWRALCSILGLDEYTDDERFATYGALVSNWKSAEQLLAPALRAWSVGEFVGRAQQARLAASAAYTTRDVLRCAHLAHRGYWSNVEVSRDRGRHSRRLRFPPLAPTLAPPEDERRPAPEAGAHTAEVIDQWRRPADSSPFLGLTDSSRPLQGVTVIELTTSWAGPMAGRMLASLGADVIKVENLDHPDAWRGGQTPGDPRRYPDLDPGPDPYNRSSWFNAQNLGKRSVELDLKDPEGVAVMLDLIERADLFLSNLAPGSLPRLGLDPDVIRARNPCLITLLLSGFGAGGPMAGHVGVGPTVEATTGATWLMGYGDGRPQGTGAAYLDPISAWSLLGTAVSALYGRSRDDGSLASATPIELNLRENALQWMGEFLCEEAMRPTTHVTSLRPNADRNCYAQAVLPALGADAWIAVRVETSDQLVAAGFNDLDVLRDWVAGQPANKVAQTLQGRGIAAAPVNTGARLHDDPHLLATHAVASITHPRAGTARYSLSPIRADRDNSRHPAPAPTLGQHTEEVLAEIAGYSPARIADLAALGVIARISGLQHDAADVTAEVVV
ncbi:CoA transferase [Nocardioides sp. DS6]|uniref:CoA transferase n=1 Tax=Nocardioides eburneus TaxID=3231482 RepID=A0ABV3T0C1_9ACTN